MAKVHHWVDNDKEVKRVIRRCYTVNKVVIYFNVMFLLLPKWIEFIFFEAILKGPKN